MQGAGAVGRLFGALAPDHVAGVQAVEVVAEPGAGAAMSTRALPSIAEVNTIRLPWLAENLGS